MTAVPEPEPVINEHGDTIAVLRWKPNGPPGEHYALIDNGTLIRHPDGTVTAKYQHRATGKVTTFDMPDTVTAFYALGLSAHRCNGIDGWLELSLMPGTAGAD